MAVATAGELSGYMSGIRMSEAQKATATMIIEGVQAELERYINRPIDVRQMREAVLTDASGFASLTLSPVHRVIKVTSVEPSIPGPFAGVVEGDLEPFDGPSYDVVPENFGRDLIVPGGVYLGQDNAYFVIEYEAGGGDWMAPYIPGIKLAVLRVAAREFQQMSDDTISLRNTNAENPVDPVPVEKRGWLESELKEFDRIRRRVIV